jgi:dissimilatory sulfite reductase (desulfoviridin) alpha/beta subunit
MALWLLRGLRRQVVTTRYPARPDPSAALLPTPPAFDPRRLTRELADRLVRLCPSRALRPDGDALLLDVGACTACGRCIQAAGDAARPSGVFELAATDPGQLRKRIPIQGATQ